MKDYVKDKMDSNYFLWRVDVSILIFQGLVIGFKESSCKIKFDENELKAKIEHWINKTVGSQKFTVTLFLVKLGALRQIRNISWIKSRSILWNILKRLLGSSY